MVNTLASRYNISEDHVLRTMTEAQIILRYHFYIRERHRDAKIHANNVAASLAEVLMPAFQALAQIRSVMG